MRTRFALIAAGAAFACPALAADRTETVDAKALALHHIVGEVNIRVEGSGPIAIAVSGEPDALATVRIARDGDTARIEQKRTRNGNSWLHWFEWREDDEKIKIRLDIVVPEGTALQGDALIGELNVGDLRGPLQMRAIATDAAIGALTRADIEIAGAGDFSIASVEESARISIKGGGDVSVGRAGSAEVSVAGAGDVSFGDVAGAFSASIAGGGEIKAASVNGPVSVSIAGAGDVGIASGRADPFSVSIVGAGSVDFGGEAVNPQISAVGSGDVRMRSYSGNLRATGMVSVRTGE